MAEMKVGFGTPVTMVSESVPSNSIQYKNNIKKENISKFSIPTYLIY